MKIIKRNGAEVGFDITKIIIAITKANESVEEVDRMTPVQIQRIAESVDLQCHHLHAHPHGGGRPHGIAPRPWLQRRGPSRRS